MWVKQHILGLGSGAVAHLAPLGEHGGSGPGPPPTHAGPSRQSSFSGQQRWLFSS